MNAPRMHPFNRTIRLLPILAAFAVCSPSASAVTRDDAIERCRASVGRPIVMSCMQRLGGGPDNLERCREQASPTVRQCVMKTMGGGPAGDLSRATDRKPADQKRNADGDRSANADPPPAPYTLSDIAQLPPDPNRHAVALTDIGRSLIVAKTTYENTVKSKSGFILRGNVAETLRIKIVSRDMIEVEREFARYDKSGNMLGPMQKGSSVFELGKIRQLAYDVVWKFEGSTLYHQTLLTEGALRKVIPIYRDNDGIKCAVMLGYARENGVGPVRTPGVEGAVVEILSTKKIQSSCDVVQQ